MPLKLFKILDQFMIVYFLTQLQNNEQVSPTGNCQQAQGNQKKCSSNFEFQRKNIQP